ncbi:MAG: response regulator [Pseudomonadales bacterium]|nr:response regulator [Pseudomonadales bacterium]
MSILKRLLMAPESSPLETIKILLVDDDPSHVQLVEYLLKGKYELSITDNGEDALKKFRHEIPDLVLLDINMPGMNGIEVCKAIKAEDYNDDVAIIFVSGVDSVDERAKGYDAGGDDFIVKPFQVGEFRKKIDATARYQQTKKTMERQHEQARTVAFESMKEASQYGQVLQFLKESFHQDTLEGLNETLFKILNSFSLSACIQVRLPEREICLRPFGQSCSPIETELFEMLRDKGRLYIFGERMIVNDQHVSLLIKNLPIEDDNLVGRIKDVMAVIVEGYDARLMDIQRKQAIVGVLAGMDDAMDMVNKKFHEYTRRNVEIMDELIFNMNESMHILGLTDEQEKYYFDMAQRAMMRLVDACDYGQNITEEMTTIKEKIKPLIE